MDMKRAFFLLFSCFTLCLSVTVAHADQYGPFEVDANGFIKDRYTIAFMPRVEGEIPLVPLPRPEDRLNPVPMGQIPAWVDKAAIGQALNLDGEVLTVWMSMNAILVRMSATEATRISADPRVRWVQQSQIGVVDGTISSQEPEPIDFRNNPELTRSDSFALRLPFVDYNGIPGLYQDAKIEYLPQNNTWRLSGYTRAVPIAEIEDVHVIVTDEVPVQVFLELTGSFTNGCQALGEVGMKRINDVFAVYLFYKKSPFPPGTPQACTADVRPFRKVIPLGVYGLTARTYSWNVNSKFGGSFTLAADNVLP
jgi:hypothetical protein